MGLSIRFFPETHRLAPIFTTQLLNLVGGVMTPPYDGLPDKSKFRLSGLNSLYNITTRKAVVILSGAPAKSKDLRISFIFAVKLVPRSFDSLRSLRMTAALVSF